MMSIHHFPSMQLLRSGAMGILRRKARIKSPPLPTALFSSSLRYMPTPIDSDWRKSVRHTGKIQAWACSNAV